VIGPVLLDLVGKGCQRFETGKIVDGRRGVGVWTGAEELRARDGAC
jgi:hypothetical protein